MELPIAFAERMKGQLGTSYSQFEAALQQPAPISIRINELKLTESPALARVPWASTGYYLPVRPQFTLDPRLHAGAYYVQEASSMFLEQALRQTVDLRQDVRALDLCGAPGGKSTHLASLLTPNSLLVSNEVIRSRASILAENVTKWGSGNVVVTNSDPRDFSRLSEFFDVMVVDAPCSGEGMFRKDPQAMQEWSEDNVNLCAQRQQRILSDVWGALKPGGILVYSTCTWNLAENEENMAWLAEQEAAEPLRLQLDPAWGIEETSLHGVSGYRFYPHRLQGEGFFLTVLRKAGVYEEPQRSSKKKKHKLTLAGKKEQAMVNNWLVEPERFAWLQHGEVISAIPENLFEEVDQLYQNLYVVYAGTEIAEAKGKKLKPLQALALSQYLNKEAFRTEELDLELALRYLRKEDIPVAGNSNDWLLMTFSNLPLGWAKQIGSRINNYFPKEWRIRMDLPERVALVNWGV